MQSATKLQAMTKYCSTMHHAVLQPRPYLRSQPVPAATACTTAAVSHAITSDYNYKQLQAITITLTITITITSNYKRLQLQAITSVPSHLLSDCGDPVCMEWSTIIYYQFSNAVQMPFAAGGIGDDVAKKEGCQSMHVQTSELQLAYSPSACHGMVQRAFDEGTQVQSSVQTFHAYVSKLLHQQPKRIMLGTIMAANACCVPEAPRTLLQHSVHTRAATKTPDNN